MSLCIYVYMYICMYVYVCIYRCLYVYVYIYRCIYVYIYVCVCVYIYICIQVYMYICIYICIYIYIYVYTGIYVYMYICTFVCIHTHIYIVYHIIHGRTQLFLLDALMFFLRVASTPHLWCRKLIGFSDFPRLAVFLAWTSSGLCLKSRFLWKDPMCFLIQPAWLLGNRWRVHWIFLGSQRIWLTGVFSLTIKKKRQSPSMFLDIHIWDRNHRTQQAA